MIFDNLTQFPLIFSINMWAFRITPSVFNFIQVVYKNPAFYFYLKFTFFVYKKIKFMFNYLI